MEAAGVELFHARLPIGGGARMGDADQRPKQVGGIKTFLQIAVFFARLTNSSNAPWIKLREPS
jgi:hypothetical protein